MRNRPLALRLCILSVLFSAGCARHAAPVPHDLALPSGEHVAIFDAHGDTFKDINGARRRVFYVSYETSHGIDDSARLRQESLRVWAVYKPDVVGVDYDSCVITPMKRTAGSGSEAGHPFYFTRRADNTWKLAE